MSKSNYMKYLQQVGTKKDKFRTHAHNAKPVEYDIRVWGDKKANPEQVKYRGTFEMCEKLVSQALAQLDGKGGNTFFLLPEEDGPCGRWENYDYAVYIVESTDPIFDINE